MAQAFFITTGIKEIDQKFSALEKKIQRKVVRQAQRQGAKEILKIAKSKAPVKSGATKKALKIKSAPRSRKFIGIDIVIGAGNYVGKQFYASFLEFGSEKIERGKYSFITPSYEEGGEKVKSLIITLMLSGIEKEASAAR